MKKQHSNLYHELGGKYHRSRITFWSIVVLVIVIVLLALAYQGKASTTDYRGISKCIETYKAINQDGVKPLYPVGQCVQHPTIIK